MNDRIVKPRRRTTKHLQIIALGHEGCYVERKGEIFDSDSFPRFVQNERPSLIVAQRMGLVLKRLDELFGKLPNWQFKLKPIQREIYSPTARTQQFIRRTVVCFFGFRDANRHNNYHHPLDPSIFVSATINELLPDGDGELAKLVSWGEAVRAFVEREQLRWNVSAGGLSNQLLRDHRFYPEPRRKIPKRTNLVAREQLPGNHYELRCDPDVSQSATYIDMEAAHHTCAVDLPFPCANTLYASGQFHCQNDRPHPQSKRLATEHGLLYVRARIPAMNKRTMFAPPFMAKSGSRLIWIFSNELPSLYALGGEVEYVIAAWTSPDTERGLNRYARWALSNLTTCPRVQRRWLKPVLLTTYGLLAARPRQVEFGYRVATGGIPTDYPVERGALRAHTRRTANEIEVSIANVVHRGMIEAELRRRVLDFARDLDRGGLDVLAIYADSLFVSGAVPLLPHPWRVKDHLTDLRFFSPTSFESRELTRLPGIPREARERVGRRQSAQAVFRQHVAAKPGRLRGVHKPRI